MEMGHGFKVGSRWRVLAPERVSQLVMISMSFYNETKHFKIWPLLRVRLIRVMTVGICRLALLCPKVVLNVGCLDRSSADLYASKDFVCTHHELGPWSANHQNQSNNAGATRMMKQVQ